MIILPIAVGSGFLGWIYLLFFFYVELRVFIFLVKKLLCLGKIIILAVWKFLRSSKPREIFRSIKTSIPHLFCLFWDGLRCVPYRRLLFVLAAILLSLPLSVLVGILHGAVAILGQYSTEVADTIFWLYFFGSYPILSVYLFKRIKRFWEKRFPLHSENCSPHVS